MWHRNTKFPSVLSLDHEGANDYHEAKEGIAWAAEQKRAIDLEKQIEGEQMAKLGGGRDVE